MKLHVHVVPFFPVCQGVGNAFWVSIDGGKPAELRNKFKEGHLSVGGTANVTLPAGKNIELSNDGSTLHLDKGGRITAKNMDTTTFNRLSSIAFTGGNRGFSTVRGTRFATNADKTIFCVDCRQEELFDGNGNRYHEWYPFTCGEDFGMSGFCELWGSLFRYRRMADVEHQNEKGESDPEPWGGSLGVPNSHDTKDVLTIRDMRFAEGTVSGNIYFGNYDALRPATPDTTALSQYETSLCIGERSFWSGNSRVGLVGDCLAFDSALTDDQVAD